VGKEDFGALCEAVRGAEVTGEKDGLVYAELLRTLSRTIDARDERLGMSTTRIPGPLWALVVFVSIVVSGGFMLLGGRSPLLALTLVTAAAGSLTFILSVLRDMDNPFVGVWNVSYSPFASIAARIA
jgi:hypothetical protein